MPTLAMVGCHIAVVLWAGDVAAGLRMQFGNFRIKGLMLKPSIPLPPPGLFPEKALPNSAHLGAALKQPGREQQHPGVAPGLPDDVWGGRAAWWCLRRALCHWISLRAAMQSPGVSPAQGSACLVPPASNFFTSSGEIAGNGKYLAEGSFRDRKRGRKGSFCLNGLLLRCCSGC